MLKLRKRQTVRSQDQDSDLSPSHPIANGFHIDFHHCFIPWFKAKDPLRPLVSKAVIRSQHLLILHHCPLFFAVGPGL
jgi:hypothetical protein